MATYVESFKNRLKDVISCSYAHLRNAQSKMKRYYDEAHKVKLREFKKGDLVLVLLPMTSPSEDFLVLIKY